MVACRVRWTLPDSSQLEGAEALVQDMRSKGANTFLCMPGAAIVCCAASICSRVACYWLKVASFAYLARLTWQGPAVKS